MQRRTTWKFFQMARSMLIAEYYWMKCFLSQRLESLSDLFDGDQDRRNMSDVLSKLCDVHQKKLDVIFKDVCMLARIYLECPITSESY